MAIQLVTDQLSNVVDDKLRSQFVGNFKVIEKALNDLDTAQATLNSDKDMIIQDLKNIKDDNEIRDANVQAIVNILTKYDVPIQIVNGKVVETEEGE
ncbi:hypothetical protein FIV11_04145 [Lactiplantibacillus plantarum]|uniref:hypothetical protein n=1 Tax=Lactiplantibacillus plantarum TaxID=1590 RepID=UPI00264A51FD|nr:hypothetical protein [Lactiplantibacillus plantarum]MDN7060920.1 hypothetical protein [Lactiplantibacillus plantarum]